MRNYLNFHLGRATRPRALLLIYIGALPGMAFAQCGSIDRGSPVAVAREVDRIYNETLDAMESTLPSGMKVATWRPPGNSVRDQITCLGAPAVPEIAKLLRNHKRSFDSYLTIQMLGWAGGPEIVPPLAEILSRSDPSQTGLKLWALESLASAPPDKALPVVQEVLRSEKDPQVLKEAASVAERLKGSAQN